MAQPVTFTVDKASLNQLSRALRQYADVRKMDDASAVNRTSMNLAFRAAEFTKRASAAEISALLQAQVGTQTHGKKRRLKRPKAIMAPTTAGKLMFIKKLRTGTVYYKGFPSGATDPKNMSASQFNSSLMKYIKRRISSAAYIAAGFLPAGKRFQAAYRGPSRPRSAGIGRKRMGIGKAIIAVPGTKPHATIINASISKDPGSSAALLKHGGAGVRKAISFVTRDMLEFVKRQIAKQNGKFNSKRR